MGDVVTVQRSQLVPDLYEQVVGDLGPLQAIEWRAGDCGVDEQHRFVTHGNNRSQFGRPCAGAPGEEGDECLVFRAAAQARERPFITDVLEPDEPVRAEQEICRSLFRAEHLGVDPRAVGEIAEVRRGRPERVLIGFELGHVEPARGQRRDDRSHGRALVGPPVRQENDAARHRPDREAREQLGWEIRGYHEPGERDQDDRDHSGSAPAWTHERSEDHEGADDFRDDAGMNRGGVDGDAVRRLANDPADLGAMQRRQRDRHERSGEDVAGDDVAEEPVPLRDESRHEYGDRDQAHRHLGRAGDEAVDLGRSEREQTNQVSFDATDAVLSPQRQRPEQRRERCEGGQPEHIARGPDVADDLLGRVVTEQRAACARRKGGGSRGHRSRRCSGTRPPVKRILRSASRSFSRGSS